LADTIRIVRGELTVHSALEEKRLDVVGRRALSSPADSACGLRQGRHEPAEQHRRRRPDANSSAVSRCELQKQERHGNGDGSEHHRARENIAEIARHRTLASSAMAFTMKLGALPI